MDGQNANPALSRDTQGGRPSNSNGPDNTNMGGNGMMSDLGGMGPGASGAASSVKWEAGHMLDVYILDYLRKRQMKSIADTFQNEAQVPDRMLGSQPAPVAIDASSGFLYEWWSMFWDIYQASADSGDQAEMNMFDGGMGQPGQHGGPMMDSQDIGGMPRGGNDYQKMRMMMMRRQQGMSGGQQQGMNMMGMGDGMNPDDMNQVGGMGATPMRMQNQQMDQMDQMYMQGGQGQMQGGQMGGRMGQMGGQGMRQGGMMGGNPMQMRMGSQGMGGNPMQMRQGNPNMSRGNDMGMGMGMGQDQQMMMQMQMQRQQQQQQHMMMGGMGGGGGMGQSATHHPSQEVNSIHDLPDGGYP